MSFTKIDHYEKEYVDHHHDSALSVTEGVADQPIVNPYFVRKKKHRLSTEEYVKGILEGNITTLSQAITLIESSNPDHYAQAQEIIERCLPHAGRSVRIGITGVPGAGKSTFIEAIGNMVTSLRHKLAVLAIDPSSERSGGSILGDKTRMESISANPDVFIRPSPSAGSLGGVARKTRETIVLCEAAGGLPEGDVKVLNGGPMMGRAMVDLSSPVTKGCSGITVLGGAEAQRGAESACIKCAKCVQACPMGLEPYLLSKLSRKQLWERLEGEEVTSCIECGCCQFTCPADLPLLDYIRLGKQRVMGLIRARAAANAPKK